MADRRSSGPTPGGGYFAVPDEPSWPATSPQRRTGTRGPRPKIDLEITPAAANDLAQLRDRAHRNPEDLRSYNVFMRTVHLLRGIQQGHPGTKQLTFQPGYPDLSDCRSTYVGTDPDQRPSHRIVWREVPPDADQPGQRPRREVIAVGERERGRAYHLAGQRLGRPVDVPLAELDRQGHREPVHPNPPRPTRSQQQTHALPGVTPPTTDPQPGG